MTMSGHHTALALYLSDKKKQYGFEYLDLTYYSHYQLDAEIRNLLLDSGISISHHFTVNYYELFEKNKTLSESNCFVWSLTKQYVACFNNECSDYTNYLHPSMSWEHLLSLGYALLELGKTSSKKHIVCLVSSPGIDRNGYIYDDKLVMKYKMAINLLVLNKNVEFYVSDYELQSSFKHLTQLEIFGLHPSFVIGGDFPEDKLDQNLSKFIILYLGEAKTEKGFRDLPNLLDSLLSSFGSEYIFYIQYTNHWGNDEIIEVENILKNMSLRYPNILIDKGYISDRELDLKIRSAEFIFFNYSFDAYKYKSSGLLWKACNLGVSIVFLLKNSWLHREADRLGANIYFYDFDKIEKCDNYKFSFSRNYRSVIFNDFYVWLLEKIKC